MAKVIPIRPKSRRRAAASEPAKQKRQRRFSRPRQPTEEMLRRALQSDRELIESPVWRNAARHGVDLNNVRVLVREAASCVHVVEGHLDILGASSIMVETLNSAVLWEIARDIRRTAERVGLSAPGRLEQLKQLEAQARRQFRTKLKTFL